MSNMPQPFLYVHGGVCIDGDGNNVLSYYVCRVQPSHFHCFYFGHCHHIYVFVYLASCEIEILLIKAEGFLMISAYWTNIFQVSTFVRQFFAEIAGDINMDDSIQLIERYGIQFKLLELERQEFGIWIEILWKKFFFSLTFVIYCTWKLKWMILGGFLFRFLIFLLSVTEHCDSHKIASKSWKTIRYAVQRIYRLWACEKRIWGHEYCKFCLWKVPCPELPIVYT